MPNSEVITVVMLTEAEQRFAEEIEGAVKRISSLRVNCMIGGMLALLASLVAILLMPTSFERFLQFLGAVGEAFPLIVFGGMLSVGAVGCILWYLMYARSCIRRQLAILSELAANPEIPRLRWKLHRMRAAREKLAWPASLELQLTSTVPRSIRRLFPKFTI